MRSYRRAAVASTFSPNFRALLAEADAFARHLGAGLDVVHASAPDEEKGRRFQAALDELKSSASIRWAQGETPSKAILQEVQDGGYDLLIAGALERETTIEGRSFTGSVARALLAEAPCDLLLLPKPVDVWTPPARAVLALEPGDDVHRFVLSIMSSVGLKSLTLAVAETPFAAAIAASKGEQALDVETWLDKVASSLEELGLEVDTRLVNSNTGFGLCEAILGLEPDLLLAQIVRSKDGHTALPAHLGWLHQVIPCRLWVVVD